MSGARPTGRLHIGHYFGILINYLRLQQTTDCFFMVADLHALTTGDLSKSEVGALSRELLIDWLSVGVDPEKATLFVQSSVPEHSELYLIFSMLTSLGWLERNPSYKEQKQELGEKATGSLGFLGYPVLQAVDVSIYKGTKVPIGADQKPHLEMGRELIRRFNTTFNRDVFPEYEGLLTATPKLLGLDRRKMSKSYHNTIELSEPPEQVRKKIHSMITDVDRPRREDPGHPENCNVFTWHQLFSPPDHVALVDKTCRNASLGCGDDKKDLADRIIAWQEPIREKRAQLEKDLGYLDALVRKGNEKARGIAAKTVSEVREVVGFWPKRP